MAIKVCFRASAAASISLKAQNDAATNIATTKNMTTPADEAIILLRVTFKED